MISQLEMFVQNMRLLVGLIVFFGLLLIVGVAVWTGLKIGIFRASQRQEREASYRRTHGPDGELLPPATAGVCERCQGVSEKVYHLPSGQRLCAACYATRDEK